MSKKSIEMLQSYLKKLHELDSENIDMQSLVEISSKLREESFLRAFTAKEQEQILAASKDLESKKHVASREKIKQVLLAYNPL